MEKQCACGVVLNYPQLPLDKCEKKCYTLFTIIIFIHMPFELKLFGKNIFEFRKAKSDMLWTHSNSVKKESKFLPDFHSAGSNSFGEFITIESLATATPVKKKEEKKKSSKIVLTPKGVHELRLLHDDSFLLNTDAEYVDKQLADFKDKLALITSEEYDMSRGVKEIASIILRLENRKKYETVKDFFELFAYTTTSKIDGVVKLHDNLKLGQVAQFIADMPKEATQIMKEYNAKTVELCDKQAVFYIIADQKDFKNTTSRRDPILLAQSPFGHFWNICGAWDKEMLFLEEL